MSFTMTCDCCGRSGQCDLCYAERDGAECSKFACEPCRAKARRAAKDDPSVSFADRILAAADRLEAGVRAA